MNVEGLMDIIIKMVCVVGSGVLLGAVVAYIFTKICYFLHLVDQYGKSSDD